MNAKLSQDLPVYIYAYNPEHRAKMYWALHAIRNTQFCEVCDKVVMNYVWSSRRGEEICCSEKCLDNYKGCLYYRDKWWK